MLSLLKLSRNLTAAAWRREIMAGCTTFLAMMYIIIVNPTLLHQAGLPYQGVLTATVIVASLGSILMGVLADNPVAIAPTMGMNTFFTYTVVMQMHVTWQVALGTVFWAGVLFVALTAFNFRTWILKAIPMQLRFAVAAGIGLFISVIGFRTAGFIVFNKATLTSIGNFHPSLVVFLIGLVVTATLIAWRFRGALILGIIITTILLIPVGRFISGSVPLVTWHGVFAWPDFSTFMQMNLTESFTLALLPVSFTFLFTTLFDGLSTLIGVSEAGGLLDKHGVPRNIKQALFSDALASVVAGMMGSSSAGAYVESAAGIKEGGKTGWTAIVVGVLFLPFLFLAPLTSVIPPIATAPVLVLIGVFMVTSLGKINWQQFDDAFPAFVTVSVIPLANSITLGIIWGLLAWSVIKILIGQFRKVGLTLIIVDIIAVFLLYIEFKACP